VVTGHRGKDEHDHRIDWRVSAQRETLVILMGTAWLETSCAHHRAAAIRRRRLPRSPAA
jgi:siroheme synthase